jgi:hypothetical protein|tara:strand:+ start:390 stop:1004 length:615 start_codon:yes stop_codon:yes gene_type:complete
MKATEILNKIKGIVGVELAEETVNLAEMKLENGTVLVAEEFKAGEAIFIKSEEEQIALPVGEYKLENDMVLVVKEEGLISEIKEVEAEKEEEEKEEVEAAELEKEEEKEEMRYVTKEEFTKAVDEIKAMIDKMGKDKEEMSEETATEEVKEELQETELSATKEEAVEPIKHNPETEQNKKGKFLFGQKRTETTMDRVFSKIASN